MDATSAPEPRRGRSVLGAVAAVLAACSLMSGCRPGTAAAMTTAAMTGAPSLIGTPIAKRTVLANLPSTAQARRYGWSTATRRQVRSFAASLEWRRVRAAGVTQAIACTGTGSPTVVYVNGWQAPAIRTWSLAARSTARITRVCLFDRPGSGLSPKRPKDARRSTPQQQADEMLALLATVGETGPFVLVPWSYGGLVARAAGAQRSDQVAGMVLVDAMSPLRSRLETPWHGEHGIVDTSTMATTVGAGPDLGSHPLIVLTEETFAGWSAGGRAESLALQEQAATLSSNSVHGVVLGANHHIPMRNAQAVVAATAAVVLSVRIGDAALGACPPALAASGTSCQEHRASG